MTERPDLEAIERQILLIDLTSNESTVEALESLIAYCRELEADNKKLQGTIAQIYDQVQRLAVDAWIKKWTFEGGAYDDAPPMPKA